MGSRRGVQRMRSDVLRRLKPNLSCQITITARNMNSPILNIKNRWIKKAAVMQKSKPQSQTIRRVLCRYIPKIDRVTYHKSCRILLLYLKMGFARHRSLQIPRLFYPIF